MNEPRELIAAFLELNRTNDRNVAMFIPSLVGMFGSIAIFDTFLSEIDEALASMNIEEPLKRRAANLIGTFIPQVAEYNGIKQVSSDDASVEGLRNITATSLEARRQGTVLILSSLIAILMSLE